MALLGIKFSLLFDALAGFFLFVILLVSIPSAVYSLGYLKGGSSRRKIASAWALLLGFVISMALVVTARNAMLFIVAWEAMSLVSFFLVIFDTDQEKSIKAGIIYIIMTHVGTAFIILAILGLSRYARSFDILALKSAASAIPQNIKNILFIMFLIGFGTKAGIVPLHIWLPYAHPQAPSHISSIMSGVMIKTAIYGLIRFVIFVLGIGPAWWGNLVLLIGAISCLVGVLYALMEHDIKKLLAYHSVENIGIILLGIGSGMVFLTNGNNALALFAFVAGLYHLINHATFKGLLFLCAGSIYKATGKRNIEKFGGLIKAMPWTASFFLIGAMAISALPPLNGFISEWLTFQAFFSGILQGPAGQKLFFGAMAAVLALTSGLAAACFVKAFGVTFLGMPRSKEAIAAREVSFSMKAGMAFLALMTIALGLGSPFVIRKLGFVASSAIGVNASPIVLSSGLFIQNPVSQGAGLSNPIIAIILIAGVILLFFSLAIFFNKNKVRYFKTWDCGYYNLDARTEYTATGFSKPFRIAFDFFFLPYRKTEKIRESYYHIKSFKYGLHTTPIFKKYIYIPIVNFTFGTARSLRAIQAGSVHLYISYIFVVIVLLIIFGNRF